MKLKRIISIGLRGIPWILYGCMLLMFVFWWSVEFIQCYFEFMASWVGFTPSLTGVDINYCLVVSGSFICSICSIVCILAEVWSLIKKQLVLTTIEILCIVRLIAWVLYIIACDEFTWHMSILFLFATGLLFLKVNFKKQAKKG